MTESELARHYRLPAFNITPVLDTSTALFLSSLVKAAKQFIANYSLNAQPSCVGEAEYVPNEAQDPNSIGYGQLYKSELTLSMKNLTRQCSESCHFQNSSITCLLNSSRI